ncbi:MAG: ankyrin repeat domain-containing protein [Verrucomicrobiales bacterium]
MVRLFSGNDKALRQVWVRKVKNGDLDGEEKPLTENSLHLAILNAEKTVKFLLEKKTPQVAGDELGYTSLALALERKKWATAQLLIENGADVHAVTDDGKTMPILICESIPGDQMGLVDLLVREKVDVNKVDKLGRTALFEALDYRNGDQVVEKLLAAGANLNGVDVLGNTPLLRAVSRVKIETATLLVKAPADPNVKSPQSNGSPVLSVLISTLFADDISAA